MWRSFCSDNRGVVLILTAISLPALLLIVVAFSIVTAFMESEQNRLQGVADFAARYAAIIQVQGGNIDTAAKAFATYNQVLVGDDSSASSVISVDANPSTDFSAAGYPNAVKVKITKNYPTIIPWYLPYKFVCQSTTAAPSAVCIQQNVVAVASGASVPCLAALNKTSSGNTGIKNNGSVNLKANCPIVSNDPEDKFSITLSGVSGFDYATCPTTGNYVCATAFIANGTSNSAIASSVYYPKSPQIDYPFAGISTAIPSAITTTCDSGCVKDQLKSGLNLKPNTVYECLQIPSGAKDPSGATATTLTLNDGQTYYARGINLSGGQVLTGQISTDPVTGVISVTGKNTIVIVPTPAGGGNCSGTDLVSVTGTGTSININAPTDLSSPFEGIGIIGDSGLTDPSGGPPVTISGGGGSQGINGAVAFQNASIKITGSSAPVGGCQSFYGYSIVVSGTSSFGSGCNSVRVSVASMRGNILLQ